MLKISLIVFFAFLNGYAQISVQIRNKQTQNPIAYANIWKENSLYKTADSIGVFEVNEKEKNNYFKVTCLGFKDTLVMLEKEIWMQPNSILLDDVEIVKRKFKKFEKFGKASRGDGQYAVQWNAEIGMTAKYFPNLNSSNSFLSKISFYAFTSAKNRLINVFVYSVNENGTPNKILNTENIVYRLKKGNHKIEIRLDSFNIKFPSNGVFVVLQHPLLEQNKNYDLKSKNPNAFFYEPLIATNFTDVYKDSWFFKKDSWNKNEKYSLAIELQISD